MENLNRILFQFFNCFNHLRQTCLKIFAFITTDLKCNLLMQDVNFFFGIFKFPQLRPALSVSGMKKSVLGVDA